MIHITIPGEPQGKARGRTFIHSKTGKFTTMTPEKTVNYENLIKTEAFEEMTALLCGVCTGPVEMVIKAYYGIPKSYTKRKQNEARNNVIRPTKKPDADNIAKVICDALNGIAYKDDTQVVRLTIEKWYTDIAPRVEIELQEVA